MKNSLLLLISIFLFSIQVEAQESLFENAIKLKEEGKHEEAIVMFKDYLKYSLNKSPIDNENAAKGAIEIGESFKILEQYEEGNKYFNDAKKFIKNGDVNTENAANYLFSGGLHFEEMSNPSTALSFYYAAYFICSSIKKEDYKGILSTYIGRIEFTLKNYPRSATYYKTAIKVFKNLDEKESLATSNAGLAKLYAHIGKYEFANSYANKAIKLADNIPANAKSTFNNSIGDVFFGIEAYEKAIKYYKKALELDVQSEEPYLIYQSYDKIAQCYQAQKLNSKAMESYSAAIKIANESGWPTYAAKVLHKRGMLYINSQNYEKAKADFEMALEINVLYDIREEIANNKSGIGQIAFEHFGLMSQSIENLNAAKKIYEEDGLKEGQVEIYNQLADYYVKNKDTDMAISYALKSIEIKKSLLSKYKMRKSSFSSIKEIAPTRKKELAQNYNKLASIYAFGSNYKETFEASEKAKAIILDAKINETGTQMPFSIAQTQELLSANGLLINYFNNKTNVPLYITLSDSDLNGFSALNADSKPYNDDFINFMNKYDQQVNEAVNKHRGFKPDRSSKNEIITESALFDERFEVLINYYRILIKEEVSNPSLSTIREAIAKGLYQYLITPIKSQLVGKNKLVIIPNGVLAHLPFETLITPDGKYLVEKYEIQYIHSATEWAFVNSRNYENVEREDFLGFGGANYEGNGLKEYRVATTNHLSQINSFINDLDLNYYKKLFGFLGLNDWEFLPNSEKEVDAIKAIFPTGENNYVCSASEYKMDYLMTSDKIGEFKMIHFAVNSAVIPEIPKLSALIMAQGCALDLQDKHDGIIAVPEIEKLNLNADFVNLSACETGYGKIYGGDGIREFTEAFIAAGSNGVSISLWKVADESTQKFMVDMYQNVKNGNEYATAINSVKRKFITGTYGDKNRLPNYWAPYIYYGK